MIYLPSPRAGGLLLELVFSSSVYTYFEMHPTNPMLSAGVRLSLVPANYLSGWDPLLQKALSTQGEPYDARG